MAVRATGDLDHEGEESEEEAQTHPTDKEESGPLWVVCRRGERARRQVLHLVDFLQKTCQTCNWMFLSDVGSSGLFSYVDTYISPNGTLGPEAAMFVLPSSFH